MDVNGELKFLKKKNWGGVWSGVRGRGRLGGGHGGCERRIEVFVKIQKKKIGGGGRGGGGSGGVWSGVRVDVNEELKFWGKFKKKIGGVGGSGWGGQDGCERRIEVFEKKNGGGVRGVRGRGRLGGGSWWM